MKSSVLALALGIVAVLCCCAALLAAPPVATITGPSTVAPGDPIVLQAAPIEGGQYRWKVVPDTGRLQTLGNGTICVLGNQAGTFTLVLGVSNLEGLDVATHAVTVGGDPLPPRPPEPPAPPGPGPQPPQPPTPPVPPPAPLPGKFDSVTTEVRAEASKVNRPAEARLIAAALERVAVRVERGEFPGDGKALAASLIGTVQSPGAVVTELKSALGFSALNWMTFGNWLLSVRTKSLYDGGQLATAGDWVLYLRAVARGLQ